jgi:hypothetical protein
MTFRLVFLISGLAAVALAGSDPRGRVTAPVRVVVPIPTSASAAWGSAVERCGPASPVFAAPPEEA